MDTAVYNDLLIELASIWSFVKRHSNSVNVPKWSHAHQLDDTESYRWINVVT